MKWQKKVRPLERVGQQTLKADIQCEDSSDLMAANAVSDTPDADVSDTSDAEGVVCAEAHATQAVRGVLALATPTPARYIDSLQLCDPLLHAAKSLHLPLVEKPHLTNQQCKALKQWAVQAQRRCLPNGLWDSSAASTEHLPFNASDLCPLGRRLVEHAISDLQRKIEERNVTAIQRGFCAQQARKIVLELDLATLRVAESAAVSRLGVHLDGLCRAVAEHDDILGCGGWRLLQRARGSLREWFNLDSVDSSSFDTTEAYDQVNKGLPEGIKEEVRRRVCLMAVASHDAARADLAREACGLRGETRLESTLLAAGICREEYLTEDELREAQMQQFGRIVYATPDVLFRQGHLVNGSSVVHWIDSKGSCLLPGLCFGSQLQKLKRQLEHFVELFGPGLVVWQGGFAAVTVGDLQGVRSAAWAPSAEDTLVDGELAEVSSELPQGEVAMRWQ